MLLKKIALAIILNSLSLSCRTGETSSTKKQDGSSVGEVSLEQATVTNYYLQSFDFSEPDQPQELAPFSGDDTSPLSKECHRFGILKFKDLMRNLAEKRIDQHEIDVVSILATYERAIKLKPYYEEQNKALESGELDADDYLAYPFDSLREHILLERALDSMWWVLFDWLDLANQAGHPMHYGNSAAVRQNNKVEQYQAYLKAFAISALRRLTHDRDMVQYLESSSLANADQLLESMSEELFQDIKHIQGYDEFLAYIRQMQDGIGFTRLQIRTIFPELNLVNIDSKWYDFKSDALKGYESDADILEKMRDSIGKIEQGIMTLRQNLSTYPNRNRPTIPDQIPVLGGLQLGKDSVPLERMESLRSNALELWEKQKENGKVIECEDRGVKAFVNNLNTWDYIENGAMLASTGLGVLTTEVPPLSLAFFTIGGVLSLNSAYKNIFHRYQLASNFQKADGNFNTILPDANEQARGYLIKGGLDIAFAALNGLRLFRIAKATTLRELGTSARNMIRMPSISDARQSIANFVKKGPKGMGRSVWNKSRNTFCGLRRINKSTEALDRNIRNVGQSMFVGSAIGTGAVLANNKVDPYAFVTAFTGFTMSIPLNELWCRVFGPGSSYSFLEKMLIGQGFANTATKAFELVTLASKDADPNLSFNEKIHKYQDVSVSNWVTSSIYYNALGLIFWMPHFHSASSRFPITSRNINNSVVSALGKMKNGQRMAMLFKEDELSGRAFETLAKTLGFGAASYVHFRIGKLQGRGAIKFRNCVMVSLDEKNAAADNSDCEDLFQPNFKDCLRDFLSDNCKEFYTSGTHLSHLENKILLQFLENAQATKATYGDDWRIIYVVQDEKHPIIMLIEPDL